MVCRQTQRILRLDLPWTPQPDLERIRERQAREEDRQTASATLEKELTGADLDEKLKAAGIDGEQDAVNDVLARLKGGNANP